MSATDDLIKQILGQNLTSKWTGEGYGSAQANAADMAKILANAGITDINQLGVRQDVIPASAGEWGESPEQTVNKYINKVTGQELGNTYGERQTGNFFGGTFTGKGNTGYGVQFGPDGTPYFYTQGASSNDVANIMKDLGPVGQIAAATLGGPMAVAAIGLASGKNPADILKSTALSYLGGAAGNAVSGMEGITDTLGQTGTNIASNIAKQFVGSGGTSVDPIKALIASGITNMPGDGPDSSDFIEGYFQPGGEGYIDPNKEEQTVSQDTTPSSDFLRTMDPYLSDAPSADRTLPAERQSDILDEVGTPDTLPFDSSNILQSVGNEEPAMPSPDEDFTPTMPEEDVPEMEITGERPAPDTSSFDDYLGTPTDPTVEDPESPGSSSSGSSGGAKSGPTAKPVAKAGTPNAAATPTTGTTAAPAAAATAQPQNSLESLLNLMSSNNQLAHIKSYKELFGHDLFAPETPEQPEAAPQNTDETQLFKGGHVDDFSVDALLQILRS